AAAARDLSQSRSGGVAGRDPRGTGRARRADRQARYAAALLPADPLGFARSLGTTAKTAEVRATHRRPKRRYKKRIRMPSKLDPYLATIESWLAREPQITALAIVHRLAAIDPATFAEQQHSIVQRLLRALRRNTAQRLIAEVAAEGSKNVAQPPGTVDGSG